MISYHFAGKDDLFAACVAEIEQETGAAMAPHLQVARGPVERLRAYIEADVALVAEHGAAVRALIDLLKHGVAHSPGVDGRQELFEHHFQEGQAVGAFRSFDTATVAAAIIAGLDVTVWRAAHAAEPPDPTELARLGRELADLYVRATTEGNDR